MLFVAFPFAFYLLIPIIALETWFARSMPQVPARRRFLGVLVANVFSTVIGWPLVWFVLVLLQIFVIPGGSGGYGLDTSLHKIASVTLQAAWLIPYESDLYWMVPAASIVLLVPAFLITIPSESLGATLLLATGRRQRARSLRVDRKSCFVCFACCSRFVLAVVFRHALWQVNVRGLTTR